MYLQRPWHRQGAENRIESSSGLNEDEIKKMVREAEEHAAEDNANVSV